MNFIANVLLVLSAMVLIFSIAFAGNSVAKGRALFNDPKFAGGVRPCSQCHPGGSGLENATEKKEFHIGGATQKSLEEAVNACIVGASLGKAIDIKSEQMKNIVSYIKSLKKTK